MTVAGARALRPTDPATLGGYELLGRLGEGGMGVVYLGRSAGGAYVAVKAIRAELADDPDFRRRFRSEVSRARQVPPYCTAEVLGADLDNDPPYLVVEYVDGPSLADVVAQRGPLSPANLHSLAIGVATALTAIHGAGVIHRDLKPGNVLLAPGSLKVIDFGIARPTQDASTLTDAGEIVGTVAYMAPERFGPDGSKSLTPAADVFAWGAVVAFAGTGRLPFRADSMPGMAMRIMTSEPDLDGLPPTLRGLVARALAKEPTDRPTARALFDMLTAADGVPTSVPGPVAVPVDVPAPVTALRAPAASTRREPGAVPPPPRRRRPWALLTGIFAGLLTLALAGAIATGAIPVPFLHPMAASPTPSAGLSSGSPSTSASPSASPSVTGSPSASPTGSPSAVAEKYPPAGMHRQVHDALRPPTQWTPTSQASTLTSCTVDGQGLTVTRGSENPFRCTGARDLFYDVAVFVHVRLLDPNSCVGIWLHFDLQAGYALQVCPDGYHLMVHGYPTSSSLTQLCSPVPSPLAVNQDIQVGIILRGNQFSFLRNGVQIGRGSCQDNDNLFASGHVVLGIFRWATLTSAAPTSRVRMTDVEIWTGTS